MNCDRLAKHYDRLTARERLSAINAAAIRGDDADWQRLMSASPLATFAVAEHHGVSAGLLDATYHFVIGQLELTATYWRAQVGQAEALDDAEGAKWAQLARYTRFQYKVCREAWSRFCSELAVDPNAVCERLSRMIGQPGGIPESSDSAEEILKKCPAVFADAESQPVTVADELEWYRVLFSRQEQQWS